MFWILIDIICVILLIFNLMFIFVDWFFVIKYFLIYYMKMILGKCKWIILFFWVYVGGILCFYLVDFIWKYVVIFLFGFIIFLIVILFCYGGIFYVVILRFWFIYCYGKCFFIEYKMVKSLGVVIGVFVVCWFLFFIVFLVFWYCEFCRRDIDIILVIIFVVKWLYYLNSCLNFIIYVFLNFIFKIVFRNLIRRMCGKEILNFLEIEILFVLFCWWDIYVFVKSNENGKEKLGNVFNGNVFFYKSFFLK